MAVRAEDIVRNSEVSARVRAGPPARAVPRVTDALKSATFEPQCHDRPLGVDQRHSNPWAAIASAAARGYVRCFIVQFQKPGQVSRANPVYPNFRRMRRTLTLNPVFRSYRMNMILGSTLIRGGSNRLTGGLFSQPMR